MKNIEHKFMTKIAAASAEDCWLWLGYRDKRGRGIMRAFGKPMYASRVSYILTHGSIPEGLYVLHKCDNPSCVNPNHLFLGSQQDNMQDMANKKRSTLGDRNPTRLYPERVPRGEKHHWHNNQRQWGEDNPNAKLTQCTVDAVRQMYASGAGGYIKLGNLFGINQWTVRDIVKGRRWRRS